MKNPKFLDFPFLLAEVSVEIGKLKEDIIIAMENKIVMMKRK